MKYLLQNQVSMKLKNLVLLSMEVFRQEMNTQKTLLELLKNAKFKIFDLNLRPPHYSIDTIKLLTKNAIC